MKEDGQSNINIDEGPLNFLIVQTAIRLKLDNFPNIDGTEEEGWEGEREMQVRGNTHIIPWWQIPNRLNCNMEQPGNIIHVFSMTRVSRMILYYSSIWLFNNIFKITFKTLKFGTVLYCQDTQKKVLNQNAIQFFSRTMKKWFRASNVGSHLKYFFPVTIGLHPLSAIILWSPVKYFPVKCY